MDEFADRNYLPHGCCCLVSVSPEEGNGSSHGSGVTSGIPPERGTR